jgi:prepilin-type N-terminal cleavage/methylation domain-containing protein
MTTTSIPRDAVDLRTNDDGFGLPELMISLVIVLVVFGVMTTGMSQMSNAQRTIWNRTQMHGGVRGATELLQQEIGQAGRITLPGSVSTTAALPLGVNTIAVTSAAGMYVGEKLVIGPDDDEETVTLTAVDTVANTITAYFGNAHAAAGPVRVLGGFATGIVPPNQASGSTGSILKLYGDVNGDGQMVYVEYTCDTNTGNLYRNMMPITAATKPAVTASNILLTNLTVNPGATACFTYQTATAGVQTYVTNVAITLSVRTQSLDPITKQYQTETKALLNVSPRNVGLVWQLGSLGLTSRIQPTPPSVLNLL